MRWQLLADRKPPSTFWQHSLPEIRSSTSIWAQSYIFMVYYRQGPRVRPSSIANAEQRNVIRLNMCCRTVPAPFIDSILSFDFWFWPRCLESLEPTFMRSTSSHPLHPLERHRPLSNGCTRGNHSINVSTSVDTPSLKLLPSQSSTSTSVEQISLHFNG